MSVQSILQKKRLISIFIWAHDEALPGHSEPVRQQEQRERNARTVRVRD
jgi:hypothetical protein